MRKCKLKIEKFTDVCMTESMHILSNCAKYLIDKDYLSDMFDTSTSQF